MQLITKRKLERLRAASESASRYEEKLRAAAKHLEAGLQGDVQLALWMANLERAQLVHFVDEAAPKMLATPDEINDQLVEIEKLRKLIRAEMRAYCEVA